MRRRRIAVRLPVRIAVLVLALIGGAALAQKPNLFLVTVDTLRADYLGSYGRPGDPTPNLDALAASGVLFEDTLSVIGKTGPSFGTAFSSLYPPTHGARRNGVPMRDDVPVLAEILAGEGYRTAAFVSNWTLRNNLSGVGRGFEVYDETFNAERNSFVAERTAEDVTRAALAWLEQNPPTAERPVLLWVHYSEPHTPFELQYDFAPEEPEKSKRGSGWLKRHRYASEVTFTDHWIGRLLEASEPFLPANDTYLFFFADHGESLGEHGYWGHGKNIHWPNLKVPMMLRGPGVPTGRRLSYPASLVDVLPTALDLVSVEAPAQIEGQSLRAAWEAPSAVATRHRYSFAERHTALTKSGKNQYNHPLAISLQTPEIKAVFDFGKRSLSYYDLGEDPEEQASLDEPPVEERPSLGRRLSDWYASLTKYEQRKGELSEEDLRQLKSLGYVE